MPGRLYEDRPDLYDAIQSDWDYERDVAFVAEVCDRHGDGGDRLLEVGCGTGEHTRRFDAAGYDVTAVDPAGAALDRARSKCGDAVDFRRTGLPALAGLGPSPADRGEGSSDDDSSPDDREGGRSPDGDGFDVVVALRGVLNHLAPATLEPSVRALSARLAAGGVLVFDNSPLPPADEGNHPAIDVGTVEAARRGAPSSDRAGDGDGGDGRSGAGGRGDGRSGGTYARVAQMLPAGDGERLAWRSVVFPPEGGVLLDARRLTPFEDGPVAAALSRAGLSVRIEDGFGPGDRRSVFVAVDRPRVA